MVVKVLGTSVVYSKNGRHSWTNIICTIVSGYELENPDQAFQFIVDREIGDKIEFGKCYKLKGGFTALNGRIDSRIVDLVETL